MKKYKGWIVLIGVLSVVVALHGQTDLQSIGNYQHGQWDGKWYTVYNGEKEDIVDIKHLEVRLKGHGEIKASTFSKMGLPEMRDVRGRYADGFYELEIPAEMNPFDVGTTLLNSNAFEYVYLNMYSEVSAITPNDYYYQQGEH